jgi:outer membrane lipoprotein-sorting protein
MTMRRRFLQMLAAFGSLLTLGVIVAAPAEARASTPDEAPSPDSPEFVAYVMNRIDDLHRGSSSHAVIDMEVKTVNFTRTMTMESWSKGKDHSLVRILSPKKERGTATLMSDKNLFTYLNKTGRTIKITGGMLGASWMGSHFTNDDLVRATRLADDYDIKKTFSGVVADVPIHVFALTPKPDAPVVWGKVEIAVRQDDLQPMRQIFYDEDGKKVREMVFSGHKTTDGRRLPTKLVMRPLDGSGEYTKITYQNLEFDVDIDADFFSLQRLKAM